MPEPQTGAPSQPGLVLALTFLTIGLTFALPFDVVPQGSGNVMAGDISAQATNVYAFAAWAGWAHFLYSFRGQGNALSRINDSARNGRLWLYGLILVLTFLILWGARWALGTQIFGGIVWVYFIDHFIKAEQSFEGRAKVEAHKWGRVLGSYQPLLSFAWLSCVLLNVGKIDSNPWAIWGVSLVLGAGVLVLGGWRKLAAGEVRSSLLALVFIAEALVWGSVSRYGGTAFLAGVYVFHIAAGSYFHYLGSYFFANSRSKGRDKFLTPASILLVNALVIALGSFAARAGILRFLEPVLGIQWFTLWVAVHLVLSDMFPAIRGWKGESKAPA